LVREAAADVDSLAHLISLEEVMRRVCCLTVILTSAWQPVTLGYMTVSPGLSTLDLNAFVSGLPAGASFDADDASIALHAACGFAQVGREQEVGRKFNRWLDVVLMQLML